MSDRRLFRMLLGLYPRAFRQQFGREMDRAFDLAFDDRLRGSAGRRTFWIAIVRDFVLTVPRAWWTHALRPRRHVGIAVKKERQLMHQLMRDIRYAIRGLVRQPGLAITAVTALGLGIGLTTAMFSIVNGVVLRGLPMEDPEEIVAIFRINPMEGPNRLIGRYHDFLDLRERQTSLEGLAALTLAPMNVSPPGGTTEFLSGASVTADMFSLLGELPFMGRGLDAEDEVLGASAVVVVGYRFWQDRLDGDPDIIGSTMRINGAQTTVVGVMREGFEFPINQQLWQPLRVDALGLARGGGPGVIMVGRLKDGVSIKQARADLAGIMAQLGQEFPETNAGMSVSVGPYAAELIGPQITPLLFTMLGAVSLVLVIACANVANLLLARASLRSKEVAVRTALGASRSRVIVELLIESSVISLIGAVVGIGVAMVGIDLFNAALRVLPQGVPFWFAIEIDPAVLRFVLLITVAASLLSGLIPALRASGADTNNVLKDEARGSSSLRIGKVSRSLVVLEVALSCALLVGAGLLIKSVTKLSNIDYEFATESMFTGLVTLPDTDYPDGESQRRFFRELVTRLQGEPGVLAAAVGTDLPIVGFGNGRFAIDGETYTGDRDYPSTRLGSISPEYLTTLETGVIEGRDFTPLDNAGALPVALVNEAFAEKYFPGESVLGKRVTVRAAVQQGVRARDDETWYTIVGVIPDMYLDAEASPLEPDAMYFPVAQRPAAAANIVARTQGNPLDLTETIRRVVASIDGDIPVSQVTTLQQAIDDAQWFFTIFGVMFTIFGAVALFLATVGLYGVLSFSVNQRTREVGLRIALGASPGKVMALVMRQGLTQLGVGMAIGVVMAMGLARLLSVLLYDVASSDMSVLLGVGGVLTVTGILACLVPARRATRVVPMVAMRVE